MGHYEQKDLEAVIDELTGKKKKEGSTISSSNDQGVSNEESGDGVSSGGGRDRHIYSRVVLWGFSMGAATCMLYTSYIDQLSASSGDNHHIASMVHIYLTHTTIYV